MKIALFILSTLFVSFAQANVSLHIEHPRNPSAAKDLYKVECKSRCNLEIKSHTSGKGSSTSKIYREKIKEIIELKSKGGLPESQENARLVMYKIKAVAGNKKINLVLGYPLSYTGEEFTKYSNIISLIDEIKRYMKVELMESK